MGAFSQDDHARAIDAFARAPFENGAWMEAVGLFGRAGGGWSGQLLGVDLAAGLTFDLSSDMSAEGGAEFERAGGAIVGINPRAAPSLFQQPYGIVADDDFTTNAQRRASPFYRDLFERFDADYMSLARIPDFGTSRVILSTIRSRRQGHAQGADHERMAALLPHADAALRMQAAFNARDLNASVLSLDALSIAAFLCDRWGRVIAMTHAAKSVARSAGPVTLRRGALIAADAGARAGFQRALDLACRGDGRSATVRASTLGLRDSTGGVHRIDIAPIARAIDGFPPAARAIVSVAAVPRITDPSAVLRQGYALTAAEAAVALDVAAGYTASEIAERRGASTATVRAQIKAVLAKTGQTKSTALAALIARLTG